MAARNVFLSLLISLALTFVITVLYVLYPIISLVVGGFLGSVFSREPHTDGIAAVAGGVSDSVLWLAVILAVSLFLIVFTLLQRRSSRH